ncbi:MAG: hypothetical protein CVU24_10960, partial [Betaproteobacteria bacterium HGW-Betaproteobacteria-18]
MFFHRFQPQSLKTRVTLLTLLIVVLSFLLLGYYSKKLLREELLLFTGAQQRSALSLLSAEVNHNLQERFNTLEAVASRITPSLIQDPPAAKAFLIERPFLDWQFNGGAMLWNQHGVLQADLH